MCRLPDGCTPEKTRTRMLGKLSCQLRRLVQIEKLVYGGGGLTRVEGKVEFIPYSLPEEEWLDGKLIHPSADRIEPRCSYFTDCGGCHYQQMSYSGQLIAKKAILEESLTRLGRIQPPVIETVSGPEWAYRNRSQ